MANSHISTIKQRLKDHRDKDYVPNISLSDLSADEDFVIPKLPEFDNPEERANFINEKINDMDEVRYCAGRELIDEMSDRYYGDPNDDRLEGDSRVKYVFKRAHVGYPSKAWFKKYDSHKKPNAVMPKNMLTITDPSFQNALTYNHNPLRKEATLNAYLTAVTPMFGEDIYLEDVPKLDLTIRDNMLYLGGNKAVEVHYNDTRGSYITDESKPLRPDDLDIHFLSSIYSVLFKNIVKELPQAKTPEDILRYSAEIYIPDLMEYLGHNRNYNETELAAVVHQLRSYRNIIGVIVSNQNTNRPSKDYFELLELESLKIERNVIRLCSPYMNELVCILYADEIKQNLLTEREMKMRIVTRKITTPIHSTLIKPSIVKARNKRAAEIVDVVVKLIEQTGPNGTPHISAENIIDRCPYLEVSLRCCELDRDRNRLLKKTFQTAWQYLEEYTLLKEVYKDIEFPTEIPVMKHLSNTVFAFPHKGKIKND